MFWIGGFASIPPIYASLSASAVDGLVWVPFLLGSMAFVLSGWLFMVETQRRWWLPAPRTLGWHVGTWDTIFQSRFASPS